VSWPTRNIIYIMSAIAVHKNKQLPQRSSNKQENALHSRCRSDRGLKSKEFGCTARPKIGHGTCSVKLNTFVSCSNMLVHSSEWSYGIYTSIVFATSKWYLELCTDDLLCTMYQIRISASLLTILTVTHDFSYSLWTNAESSIEKPFLSKPLPSSHFIQHCNPCSHNSIVK